MTHTYIHKQQLRTAHANHIASRKKFLITMHLSPPITLEVTQQFPITYHSSKVFKTVAGVQILPFFACDLLQNLNRNVEGGRFFCSLLH